MQPLPASSPWKALFACALLAAATGCDTQPETEVTGPVLAEAKGGGKGPPSGQAPDPTLAEFYVFETDAGEQMVHIVVDGTAAELGYQASLDHFVNGHVDGASGDAHYEFFELLAPRAGAEASGSYHHADVPFEGLVRSDPRTTFFDHPYLDVDGLGGDPFAFRVLAWRGDEAETGFEPLRFRPGGIMDAGLGLHDASAARSYGIFQGPGASRSVWVHDLTVHAVTCTETTVREGKGRDRTERTVTQVEVGGTIGLMATDGSQDSHWVEIHLYDAGSKTLSPRLTGTTSTGNFVARMDVDGTPGDVYVVVDYVYPGAEWGVYNPALNRTAGSAPGLDIPAALAVSAPVTCPN